MSLLETEMCGVKMKNPIVVASGPPTNDAEYMRLAFESGAGGVATKTLTDVELLREGQIRPKFTILQKKGYPHCFSNYSTGGMSHLTPSEFVKEVKIAKKYAVEHDAVLIGTVLTSTSLQMWKDLARMVEDQGIDILEINFGCPSLTKTKAGVELGREPDAAAEVTAAVVNTVKIPVLPKLTFDGVDPVVVGKRVKEAGAHGLVIINRIPALEVDIETGRPILVGGFAGYGGPWMRPIMLRLVARVAQEVGLPISATNGIWVWQDVVKAIMCGAHDVQTCTGILYGRKGYRIVKDYIKGLKNYLKAHNIPSVNHLRGMSLNKIKTRAEVERRAKGTIWAEVIPEKCTGCELCGNWCYYHAISFDKGGKAIIDKAMCDGCMLCRILCPKEAIVERGELPIYLGDFT